MGVVAALTSIGVIGAETPAAAVDTPLVFSASNYFFGTSTIGKSVVVDFDLTNSGNVPIGPLTVSGGEPPTAQFDMTNTCEGATLAASASCVFTLAFTPTASGLFTDTSSFTVAGEAFSLGLFGFGRQQAGTIAGAITLTNALPGSQRNVYVTSLDGSVTHQFQSQPASYAVQVPPGSYCVSFGIGPFNGTISSYPNKRSCRDGITPVTVTSGVTVPNVNATLTLSSITGTLRDHLGAVVPSGTVYATAASGTAEAFDATDGTGSYTVGNLPAGTYCLSPSGDRTDDAANGPCAAGTHRVDLAAGANVTGVTVTKAPPGGARFPGGISGTVTDQASTGLAGREVAVEPLTPFGFFTSTSTAPDGTYTLAGLPPGQYCVFVTDDGSGLAGEHYDDATSCATADPVTVADTVVAGIDMSLGAGGSITGIITNPAGGPLLSGTVAAYRVGSFRSVTVSIGAGGAYTIAGLSPGEYCVVAAQNFGGIPPRTYGGGSSCQRDITPVTVSQGATTSGIDIQLANGGTIAGTVTFPPGFVPGRDGGSLLISTLDEDDFQSEYVDVDLSGHYETEVLAPGRYCLDVRAPAPSLLVSKQVGSLTPGACTAGTIVVTDGATTTLDFSLELGGSVSGWVIAPDGTPDDDPQPEVSPRAGDNQRVRPDGSYYLTGLPAGTYCVSVRRSTTWSFSRTYDGVASCDGAYTPVTVTAGQNSGNINVDLLDGGLVRGRITRSSGGGADQVEFHRLDAAQPVLVTTGSPFSATESDYRLRVPAGTYCVLVRPHPSSGNANGAFGGTPSCAGATQVVVPAQTAVDGVDITLPPQIYSGLANPARVLDTRAGQPVVAGGASGGGAVVGGTVREVQVGGLAGVPVDAASVALNVTATGTTGPGYLTLFPCGQTAPTASNVNYTAAGQTTPNAVISRLGTGGTVCVFALTTTDVIIDVAGSFPTADGFTPLDNPARLLDTRPGQPVAAGGTSGSGAVQGGLVREVQIAGLAGVPADAASVALNVTATGTTGPGYLAVFPCGATPPTASNVNFTAAGQTTPNAVVSKLGTGGTICVFALTTTDVIIDVAGYFAAADGFVPLDTPARLLDTRPGQPTVDGVASGGGAIAGGSVLEVPVGGRAGLPSGAASVALNVTATGTTGPGYLTLFPCGQTAPTASNVNYTAAGQTTPNAVVSKLGTGGTICVFALTTTDVIIDVAGYFPEGDGPLTDEDD